MRRLSASTTNRIATSACLTLLFYLSYRYPLQINFSGTSQVYADTPFSLQIGKFLIALGIIGLIGWLGAKPEVRRKDLGFLGLIIALESFAIVKTVALGEGGFIDSAFWALAGLFLATHLRVERPQQFGRFVIIIFWISFAIDLIQIFLFFVAGRLPALAWENSLSVRFGSFLDDPNGFSVICFYFLGWAYTHPSVGQRFILLLATLLMILLAQSLTAVGFAILLLLLIAVSQLRHFRGNRLLLVGLLYFVAAAFLSNIAYEGILLLKDFKQGSIDQHADFSWAGILSRPAGEWLLGGSSFTFYESWWIQALVNLGLPWVTLHLASAFYLVYASWERMRSSVDQASKQNYAGAFTFFLFFIIGSGNLPFYTIFPISFSYYVIAYLVITDGLGTRRP